MATKQQWLDAGLTILAAEGVRGLRIERLCDRLKLSKGSFYHHFQGMGGFKTALLAHFEEECTTRYIRIVECDASASAQVKLDRLRDLALADADHGSELEVAFRAWALHDPEVQLVQQRIDRARIDYLTTLCTDLCDDAAQASDLALLLYLLLIGAGHLIPPISPDNLNRLYGAALRLLPGYQTRKSSKVRRA